MDIKDIKSLIKMVTETDITKFELESGEEKIRIQRGKSVEMVNYAVSQPQLHLRCRRSPGPQQRQRILPRRLLPPSSVPFIMHRHRILHPI